MTETGLDSGWTVEQTRSLVANAKRLGLTWELRPATVVAAPAEPGTTPILLDGDSAAIDAYSLIGLLRPGQRVMSMDVPPSGQYLVGYVNTSPAPSVVAGAVATTTGVLFTVSTGTETNISHLRLENVPVYTDTMYTFMGTIFLGNGGNAGDSWVFRWREGTALTGPIVATFLHLPVTSGFTDEVVYDAETISSFTGTANYFLSVQRIAGGGTITILGSGTDSASHSRIVRQGALTGPAPEYVGR